jgi:hypothetical protein
MGCPQTAFSSQLSALLCFLCSFNPNVFVKTCDMENPLLILAAPTLYMLTSALALGQFRIVFNLLAKAANTRVKSIPFYKEGLQPGKCRQG